jgi:two-component system, cell cycle sensor histidine kinase and response regulator CckA
MCSVISLFGNISSTVRIITGSAEVRFSLRTEDGIFFVKAFGDGFVDLASRLRAGEAVQIVGQLHSFVFKRCQSHHTWIKALGIARPGQEAVVSREMTDANAKNEAGPGSFLKLVETLSLEIQYQAEAEMVARKSWARDLFVFEAQLLQRQKMEAVGRLAGRCAREFNNLLTTIAGYANLWLVDLESGHPLRADLAEISQAADRATVLTQHFLAFNRQHPFQPEVLNLQAVLKELEEWLQPTLGEDIEFALKLDPTPGWVKVDRGHLDQIILNLVLHARETMSQGGQLTIETANVALTTTETGQEADLPPGRYVRLVAREIGPGLDNDLEEADLALTATAMIVSQNGGHFQIEGQSAFTLYLPLVDVHEERIGQVQTSAAPEQQQKTILLVEDEASVRRLVARVLRRQGYTLLEAGDGKEALHLAVQHPEPIHLLLLDLVLPGGLSGPEVARRLIAGRSALKVLYMSAYADDGAMPQPEGDAPLIHKPFSSSDLAHTIQALW